MANISREDDLKDLEYRQTHNGNREYGQIYKSQKELIAESERKVADNLKELRKFKARRSL